MDSVSSRYAIALLSLAREVKGLRSYIKMAEQVNKVFADNEDLLVMLKSYNLTKDEKKDIITTVFCSLGNQFFLNFFYVIIDNQRAKLIPEILDEFIRIGYKELNIRKGIVYTTSPLSKTNLLKLQEKTSSILNANVTLENKIDKNLLGGFKITVDDYLIDNSLAYRLSLLKDELLNKKGENEHGN